MKLSTRNQLPGTVTSVVTGEALAVVKIELAGGPVDYVVHHARCGRGSRIGTLSAEPALGYGLTLAGCLVFVAALARIATFPVSIAV
jgi:TOBE domain